MTNRFMREDDEIKLDAFKAREMDNKSLGASSESNQQILEVLLDIRNLLLRQLKGNHPQKESGDSDGNSWR